MVASFPTALIGRDDALAALQAELEGASTGRPAVVVISGETGVGKTRLVTEFAGSQRAVVLGGSCVPVAGEALPFAPLTQALRRTARSAEMAHEIGRFADLARLMDLNADVAGSSEAPASAFPQLRLFQAVLGLLQRLALRQPVIHVVEDVHWADRSTLDLERFLATNLVDEPVLVVLTYRADEVSGSSALRGWLAELTRLPQTRHLHLDRLSAKNTAALATALAGDYPDPAVLDSIVARSAGNPLFVEHLVLRGATPPPGLPETLHDLLRSRVAALPHRTQQVVRAASVIGRPASITLLAGVVDESIENLERDLHPAIDQHVIRVGPDELIGLRHPAFREVVYAELLPGERARLHGATAAALVASEDNGADSPGELARHWHRAGDLPRALEASVAAARAAERVYAFADAYESHLRALELMQVVPHDLDRVDILARAAQAAGLLGEDEAAVRLLGDALSGATHERQRAELLVMLGSVHYAAGRGVAAEAVLREALDLIPPDEVSVLAARAHLGLGRLAATWSRAKEAEVETTRALDLSVSLGARREEGRTRNAIGVLASLRGATDEAVQELRTALDIAAEIGDAEDLASAYMNLSHVLGVGGRLPEQITLCHDGVEALTRMGLVRQGGSLLMANAAESLIKLGRLAEADALLARALALRPRGIMAAPVLLRSSQLALVRGQLPQARERCAQAQAIVEAENAPSAWFREVAEVAAEVELWAGKPDVAYRQVIEALYVLQGTDEEAAGTVLVTLGLRAVGDQRETYRDPDSRAGLQDRCSRLLQSGAAAEWRPDRPDPDGSALSAALYASARAELGRAEDRGDIAGWVTARRRWSELDRPFAATYAQWREAEARLRAGMDADGIAALRGAHDAARRLGAERLALELDALARWYRVDLVDEIAQPESDVLARYGLTAREREVLAGLAAGRTNQEIADELFISVKTASVHVSNILRKFDVPHRQDAARIAHRHGVRC
ncbi:MAG: hypothetical protein QOD45_486 [Pseudonocardiales bacterium]|nr:hypothetical protein [Pseudonocardiales bacterium]